MAQTLRQLNNSDLQLHKICTKNVINKIKSTVASMFMINWDQ